MITWTLQKYPQNGVSFICMSPAAVVFQGVPETLYYLRKEHVTSPRIPLFLHVVLTLAVLKCPSGLGQIHLNKGRGLYQIQTLFLKAA